MHQTQSPGHVGNYSGASEYVSFISLKLTFVDLVLQYHKLKVIIFVVKNKQRHKLMKTDGKRVLKKSIVFETFLSVGF